MGLEAPAAALRPLPRADRGGAPRRTLAAAASALRATARRVRRRLEYAAALVARLRRWRTARHRRVGAPCRRIARHTRPGRSSGARPRRARRTPPATTLLLADLSLSTDAYANDAAHHRRHTRTRSMCSAKSRLAAAMHSRCLPSVQRSHVRMQHLKGFDEPWAAPVAAYVGAIKLRLLHAAGRRAAAGDQAPCVANRAPAPAQSD